MLRSLQLIKRNGARPQRLSRGLFSPPIICLSRYHDLSRPILNFPQQRSTRTTTLPKAYFSSSKVPQDLKGPEEFEDNAEDEEEEYKPTKLTAEEKIFPEGQETKSFEQKFSELLAFNTVFADHPLTQLNALELDKPLKERLNKPLPVEGYYVVYAQEELDERLTNLGLDLVEQEDDEENFDLQIAGEADQEETQKGEIQRVTTEVKDPTAQQLCLQLAMQITAGAVPKAESILTSVLTHKIHITPNTCYSIVNLLGTSRFPQQAEEFLNLVIEQHNPEGLNLKHLYSLLVFYYGRNYQPDDAIRVFRALYSHDLLPSSRTYNSLLYSLCLANKKDQAVQLYEFMRTKDIKFVGFALEAYISLLIDDGSSSSVLDASVAFDMSLNKDRVKFSNRVVEKLLEGYAREGAEKEIENLLITLGKRGHKLNAKQLGLIIEGMKQAYKPEKAEKFLADLDETGQFVPDYCYLSVVESYMSLKQYDRAEKILNNMVILNRMTSTPALLLYSEVLFNTGRPTDAHEVFNQIQIQDRDDHVYSVYISLLNKSGNLDKATEVFEEAKNSGVASVWSYSTLLEMYVENENYEKAKDVFEEMIRKKQISPLPETYNTMLVCYAHRKEMEKFNNLFSFMKKNQVSLFNKTIIQLINAATVHQLSSMGEKIHQLVTKRVERQREEKGKINEEMRVTGDVYRALLQMYGEQLRPDLAEKVLEEWRELPLRSENPYHALPESEAHNHLMKYYNETNQHSEVERIIKHLLHNEGHERRVGLSSFHILLDSYRKAADVVQTEKCYRQMEEKDLKPSTITFLLIIDCYCRAGKMKEAEEWLQKAVDRGFGKKELLWFTVIRGYGSAGMLEDAERVIRVMRKHGMQIGLLCYNALMEGYSKSHANPSLNQQQREEIRKSITLLFKRMHMNGIKADKWTFSSLFSIFKRDGLADEAKYLLQDMKALGYSPQQLFQ